MRGEVEVFVAKPPAGVERIFGTVMLRIRQPFRELGVVRPGSAAPLVSKSSRPRAT